VSTGVKRVVIVGQGYVGLPIAVRAVAFGHDVIGLETNDERARRLKNGDSYVEDISDSTLARCLESGRYLPTSAISECAGFDVAIVTVPTPLRDGLPDLSFIVDSADQLAPFITLGSTVILESTTYPGTTEELFVPILETGSGLVAGRDFFVGYSPERIDPGNTTWRLENTPKVVSGINEASLERVRSFYDTIVQTTVPVSGTREAELTKLLENTFRHVNVALINELAMFAADLGVDIWESIDAANTKPFGYMKFTPGPGVGGHCLPVDPSYLSWKVEQTLGVPFRFIELANDVNNHMPDYVVQRVTSMLNRDRKSVNGARILVLGMAYKKNTGDGREAPAQVLCRILHERGAVVRVVDPLLDESQFPSIVQRVDLSEQELQNTDLAIVVTDHDQFDWDLIGSTARQVLDTRHRLSAAKNVEFL
jgi:UDP-N-acetyl-D-glucosamine dehydrogenase